MNIEGSRVLVTGGAGFVGSHIVDRLLTMGADEVAIIDNFVRGRRDNLGTALETGRVRLVEGDIRDRKLLGELVAGRDLVFHQAALRITHCAAEPRAALEVMVNATFDLLEHCAAAGVRKVVAASSASVYGMAGQFPTPESEAPYDNRTLYGAAKLFNEGLLRSFYDSHGLDYVALRYFNVYGSRMDVHGRYTEVLVRWMERIEQGLPPVIFGDGLQTMDFVDVRDVARANIQAALSSASDVAFNIGTGTETSLLDLARCLAEVMDRPALTPEFKPERSVNPVPRRLADTTAAERALAFRSEIDLSQGLFDLVDWWRSVRHAPNGPVFASAA